MLVSTERHRVQIPHTEFHKTPTLSVWNYGQKFIYVATYSNLRLSWCRFQRNSQALDKFLQTFPMPNFNEITWKRTKQETISFTSLKYHLPWTHFHEAHSDSLHCEDTLQAEFQPKYGRCRQKFIIWTHFHDAHTCSKTFVQGSYTGMGDNPTNRLVAGARSRTDARGRHTRRSRD